MACCVGAEPLRRCGASPKTPTSALWSRHDLCGDCVRRVVVCRRKHPFLKPRVIGQDNWGNLAVSTVFAAVAIEAALNDYILSHCLFVEAPYLQEVFGEVMGHFLRGSVHKKIKLLTGRSPDTIPKELLKDVQEPIRIRNLIAHQTNEFRTANETSNGRSEMMNRRLTAQEMCHMLRHHEIARDFLSRFWFPGDRELQQDRRSAEEAQSP